MAHDRPPWEAPFVVPTADIAGERHGVWDLYDPQTAVASPAVVFVHGGPLARDFPASPRSWPVFTGYGALAAAAGLVGVTVDHPLYGLDDYASAYHVVEQAIEQVRDDPRVDRQRLAVWAFSGGGPLLCPLLRAGPPWLRCLAASYPVLNSRPGRELPAGFRPIQEVPTASRTPFVLTRVGLEGPLLAQGVAQFVQRAGASALDLQVIDVPSGHHGFDLGDPRPESVWAVERAVELVAAALRG